MGFRLDQQKNCIIQIHKMCVCAEIERARIEFRVFAVKTP